MTEPWFYILTTVVFMQFLAIAGLSVVTLVLQYKYSSLTDEHLKLANETINTFKAVSNTTADVIKTVEHSVALSSDHKREILQALHATEDRVTKSIDANRDFMTAVLNGRSAHGMNFNFAGKTNAQIGDNNDQERK